MEENTTTTIINPEGVSEIWKLFKASNSDILSGNPLDLQTEEKTIIGAINEILRMIENYNN